jgi:hypothetical protein
MKNHADNETMIQQTTDNKTDDIQWDNKQTMGHQTDNEILHIETNTQQIDNDKTERQ